MENSTNNYKNDNSQKSSTTVVHVIAIAYLILFIIGVIIMIVLSVSKLVTFVDCVIYVVSGVVSLVLLFSLDDAINRITFLENKLLEKGVVEESELQPYEPPVEVEALTADLKAKGIILCKQCSYQIFPEDKVCPNCGAEINRDEIDKTDFNEQAPEDGDK